MIKVMDYFYIMFEDYHQVVLGDTLEIHDGLCVIKYGSRTMAVAPLDKIVVVYRCDKDGYAGFDDEETDNE